MFFMKEHLQTNNAKYLPIKIRSESQDFFWII